MAVGCYHIFGHSKILSLTCLKELSLCNKFKIFVILISLQPLIIQSYIVWCNGFHSVKYKGLLHWVAMILKLENQSLWQKLNSFYICLGIFFIFALTWPDYLKNGNLQKGWTLEKTILEGPDLVVGSDEKMRRMWHERYIVVVRLPPLL